jgi:hypothetical protein
MRETTLGRWMIRLAVTVGVGVVALGMSTAVAHANEVGSEAAPVNLVGIAQAVQAGSSVIRLNVPEGFDWN